MNDYERLELEKIELVEKARHLDECIEVINEQTDLVIKGNVVLGFSNLWRSVYNGCCTYSLGVDLYAYKVANETCEAYLRQNFREIKKVLEAKDEEKP